MTEPDHTSPTPDRGREPRPGQGSVGERSSWADSSTYRRPEDGPRYTGYRAQEPAGGQEPAWSGAASDHHGTAAPAAVATADGDRRAGARRGGPGWGGVIATAAAMTLLGSGLTYAALSGGGPGGSAESDGPIRQTEPVVTSTTDDPDWAEVASTVGPSVVAIDVVTGQGGAAGSGVIYDEEGRVITNNHVIAGAERGGRITVRTSDGQLIPATVLGTDAATDLAVLELDQYPQYATVATFANSDEAVVGDPVAAIGNPLGLASTVTTGIVSAVERPVSASEPGAAGATTVTNAIQIDASVNPGNSGGPLFDAGGRVIGINSSIATTSATAGSVGLGFAIPSNVVATIVPQLIEHGQAEHAYLGVSMRDGTATFGGVTRAGAEVVQVEPATPAAEAGLRPGDVITGIDEDPVVSAEGLTGHVRAKSAGDEVTLSFVRGGQEQQATVTLTTRPDAEG